MISVEHLNNLARNKCCNWIKNQLERHVILKSYIK